jgi:hypothetical protein
VKVKLLPCRKFANACRFAAIVPAVPVVGTPVATTLPCVPTPKVVLVETTKNAFVVTGESIFVFAVFRKSAAEFHRVISGKPGKVAAEIVFVREIVIRSETL